MVEIKPFKGFLYDPAKAEAGYEDLVAPPYDVISPEKQDELYSKSEYGVIRLILGKEMEGDKDAENRYTRARKDLESWIRKGILAKDGEEAIYVYLQDFSMGGKRYSRSGFIGLMKIPDDGEKSVLPHEYTLAKPKKDRMDLITQVKSNLSPIFMLFEDDKDKVTKVLKDTMDSGKPVIDVDIDGERHRMWRLSSKEKITIITSELKKGRTFIADGHHRFEVARRYRDIRRREADYDGSADHLMVYFTDMSHPDNLKIFPTHRVIRKIPASGADISVRLEKYFSARRLNSMEALKDELENNSDRPNIFGFCMKGRYELLTPKDTDGLKGLISEERSDCWKSLDVSVLQYAVFDRILELDKTEGNITYVKTFEEADKLVGDGSHEAAFLLNPTRVDQLKAVAELGEMMPQKSTYFYPKVLSGLVINRFEKTAVSVARKK